MGAQLSRRSCRILVLALLGGACSIGDFPARPAGSTNDAGDGGALPALALADRCDDLRQVPVITAGVPGFRIDTSRLQNHFSGSLQACTGLAQPGNDGFLAVRLTAGELWHFHVGVVPAAADPSLYILETCEERGCRAGNGRDECGAGLAEHLSFRVPATADYLVGVDSRAAGGAPYELYAVRVVCGNGVREHSQNCDDRNTTSGDGCDARCRTELSASAAAEVEPDDDPTDANVLRMPSGAASSLTVRGSFNSACDADTYGVPVPAAAPLSVSLSGSSFCATAGNEVSVTLLGPDELSPVALTARPVPGGCTEYGTAGPLPASPEESPYFLRIAPRNLPPGASAYQLTVRR